MREVSDVETHPSDGLNQQHRLEIGQSLSAVLRRKVHPVIPYLWYRLNVVSGGLTRPRVRVDRELPRSQFTNVAHELLLPRGE